MACAQQEECCRLPETIRTLRDLASDYRRLRREVGSGCCNRYNSGLMQAMILLRDSLPPGTAVKKVTALMGKPDLRHSARYGVIELPPGTRLLIYQWRGSHDFLYFIARKGCVVKSEWYHAWE
ncbi:MAG: hypothetical protein EOP52_09400 [Sphingobacteriales bacterium]|nr:MAG: hypothetical protein EOP52_09400 [Sphingobacteriales bacterium]